MFYRSAAVLALILIGAGSGAARAQAPSPATGVAAGTVAPDGVGVTVGPSPTAGALPKGPWVDEAVIQPLQAGTKMPAGCVVQTAAGHSFDLNAAVARQPTVLIFYRGGWCPFCNAHLRQLQDSVDSLHSMGYQLLAISSDTPDALRRTMTQDKLSYQLLSDSHVQVAGKFGLRYKANDATLTMLKSHGTDLAAQNGGYLLTPGAFIVDRSGVIRFVYANNNFTVRVSQAALLEAAREALKPAPKG
jgi:peroxiredoxin